jgi:hypothetical protein
MTTRVLLAKYIRDPRRWEPINVGVIVLRGDEAHAHFLGERTGGSIDARTTRHIVGDAEVFAEWVKYWRQALAVGAEGAREILNRTTPNYWIAEQGEVWLDAENTSVEDLAARYFGELVVRREEEGDATAPQLKERVDRVIEQAGLLEAVEHFERDATVLAGSDPPERYRFHYRAQNGHITIGHRVSLDPIYLHDALWKFSNLPAEYTRVAFIAGEEAPEEIAPTLIHLNKRAHVIDAFAPVAVDEVRKLFLVGG